MLVRLTPSNFAADLMNIFSNLFSLRPLTKLTFVVRSKNFLRFFFNQSTSTVNRPNFLASSSFSTSSSEISSCAFSSALLSKAADAFAKNSFFQFLIRLGCMSCSVANSLISFSPLIASRTIFVLNSGVKFLLFST